MRVATTPLYLVRSPSDATGMACCYLRPKRADQPVRQMFAVVEDSRGVVVWHCEHHHEGVGETLECIQKADLSGCI